MGGSLLGRKDLLEEGMATPLHILAWRIPWTEEPVGLQSIGSQRVRHNLATKTTQQQQPYLYPLWTRCNVFSPQFYSLLVYFCHFWNHILCLYSCNKCLLNKKLGGYWEYPVLNKIFLSSKSSWSSEEGKLSGRVRDNLLTALKR